MTADGLDQLRNTGFVELRPSARPAEGEERTVLIVGPARSGTSAVAGVLHHLGVFMGERARPPVFEDARLTDAFEKEEGETPAEVIAAYDREHSVWAYKRPRFLPHVLEEACRFRNLQLILTFKDLLGIANRNRISAKQDVLVGLRRALRDYEAMVDVAESSTSNTLLISYEKMMSRPQESVDVIARFCGLAPSDEASGRASAFLSPDPATYLEASRVTRSRGAVDSVAPGAVRGWARHLHSEQPVRVVLTVDGERRFETLADRFRRDLLAKGVHPTGRCAFSFDDLPEGALARGSLVSVRVKDDVRDLPGSPSRVP